MKKLNTLFYKNTDMQEKLKNDNFNIENEFKQKLKDFHSQLKMMDIINQL